MSDMNRTPETECKLALDRRLSDFKKFLNDVEKQTELLGDRLKAFQQPKEQPKSVPSPQLQGVLAAYDRLLKTPLNYPAPSEGVASHNKRMKAINAKWFLERIIGRHSPPTHVDEDDVPCHACHEGQAASYRGRLPVTTSASPNPWDSDELGQSRAHNEHNGHRGAFDASGIPKKHRPEHGQYSCPPIEGSDHQIEGAPQHSSLMSSYTNAMNIPVEPVNGLPDSLEGTVGGPAERLKHFSGLKDPFEGVGSAISALAEYIDETKDLQKRTIAESTATKERVSRLQENNAAASQQVNKFSEEQTSKLCSEKAAAEEQANKVPRREDQYGRASQQAPQGEHWRGGAD